MLGGDGDEQFATGTVIDVFRAVSIHAEVGQTRNNLSWRDACPDHDSDSDYDSTHQLGNSRQFFEI